MQEKENKGGATEENRKLVATCLEALGLDDVPRITQWVHGPGLGQLILDGIAQIQFRAEELEYAVEIRRIIGRNNIGAILNFNRQLDVQGQRLLICAPYVPPLFAEEFRVHGIDFVDETGNALIRGNTTHIQIAGLKPKRTTHFAGALTATDTKLLGAYLVKNEAREMLLKDLAITAGIALGAVGVARKKLKAHGLLVNHGKRDWRIQVRAKALATFADHWGTRLRPKLAPTTYMPINTDEHGTLEQRIAALGLSDQEEQNCLIGGEYAAALMTGFLKTDFATLHVQEGQTKALARQLGLVPAPDGPVIMLERFGAYDRAWGQGLGHPMAHPLLVWAECLYAQDERAAQAAALIFDQHLIAPDGQ